MNTNNFIEYLYNIIHHETHLQNHRRFLLGCPPNEIFEFCDDGVDKCDATCEDPDKERPGCQYSDPSPCADYVEGVCRCIYGWKRRDDDQISPCVPDCYYSSSSSAAPASSSSSAAPSSTGPVAEGERNFEENGYFRARS